MLLPETSAPVFYVRNISTDELQLQTIAVMSAAEQHRLFFELHALFMIFEYGIDDVCQFGIAVLNRPWYRGNTQSQPKADVTIRRSASRPKAIDKTAELSVLVLMSGW